MLVSNSHDVAYFDRGEAWVGYASTRSCVIEQCCVARTTLLRRKFSLRYEGLGKLIILVVLLLLLLLVIQLCHATHIVVVWHD